MAADHNKQPAQSGTRPFDRVDWFIMAGLVVLVLAVFGRTVGFDFVNFDDDVFVYQSPAVTAGITSEGVRQAIVNGSHANWDPLTTISHMLDCQWFGLRPGFHHLTNVILHAATAALLFLFLFRTTGARWASAFAVVLFAVHPLRVESVAWVTERKDVLSGLFFVLTLLAYARYCREPKAGAYLVCLGIFVLGLMSKVMLVTVPFLLLLLDYWPLNRYAASGKIQPKYSRLLLEKAPFLLCAGIAMALSYRAQEAGGAMASYRFPFPARLENAIVAIWGYVANFFWPHRLAVYYPFQPEGYPVALVGMCALLLAGISAAAFLVRRTKPWLFAGWFWFLGMLFPVIGLVQIGAQAHADRYTYLPQIGLGIAVSCLAADFCKRWKASPRLVFLGSSIITCALASAAFIQTGYWKNSGTLWRHTLICTKNNVTAHNNYGVYLRDQKQPQEAIGQFKAAIEIAPNDFDAHANLGMSQLALGQTNEAIQSLKQAIAINPRDSTAHLALGKILDVSGEPVEAIEEYLIALRINPKSADAEAALAHANLKAGQIADAIAHYKTALQLNPGFGGARADFMNLIWGLATKPDDSQRNGPEALAAARWLLEWEPAPDPVVLRLLAAAYAENGEFSQAINCAQLALPLADSQLRAQLQGEIEIYRARQPLRSGK